ncbi:MAG TPA: TadE family protein [Candidatus Binataceae bacterium]|nr:TadE family protein [Candidatus Binataceae bacterium]
MSVGPAAKQRTNATECSRARSPISQGQALVEFALIAPIAMIVMVVGIQFAMLAQAALAVSQGTSAVARYAAVNPGTVGPNGKVTVTAAIKQLLSPSILSNGGNDLTITIASYSGTTTNTTSSPQYTDRLTISMSYSAVSKIALPNPFFGITFPTTLSASDSQMYE